MFLGEVSCKRAYSISSLVYLLLCACLWRATPYPAGHFDADSYLYDATAAYYATTGNLTDPVDPARAPIQSVGYHAFLGIIYKLCGHTIKPVMIIQILLMLLVIALLMRCALLIAGSRAANLVGYLAAGNIGCIIYAQLLLAEVLLLVLVVAACERLLVWLATGKARTLYTSYGLFALSMIVKPLMAPFVLIATGIVCKDALKHMRTKRALHICMRACALFACIMVAYMARNYYKYGQFAFAPMTTLNIYQCFLAKVMARVESLDEQELVATTLRFAHANTLDDAGWQTARSYFYTYLRTHPFVCCAVWMQNVGKTMLGLYSTQFKRMLHPQLKGRACSFFAYTGSLIERLFSYITGGTTHWLVKGIALAETGMLLLIWLAWLQGMWLLYRNERVVSLLMAAWQISCFLPTGIDGCCRYRLIAEPMLLIGASIGCIYWFNIKKGVVDETYRYSIKSIGAKYNL